MQQAKQARIKITSDSTCDLSPELLKKYDISLIPLYVVKDGKDYRDGVDIMPDDIFAFVDAGGELCTTAAVGVADYQKCFSQYADAYDAMIHINIGSDFSACHQNACIAAKEFSNVYAVDSRNLSSGQGHVVVEAAKMAEAGLPAGEIVEKLNELTGRVEASFIIDRLDYMRKGGRCSAVTLLGANILQLKPCIEVRDGHMVVSKKYQGSFDKCVRKYVRDRLEGRENEIVRERIFITHPHCAESAVTAAREEIEKTLPFEEIIETRAGCTVSCHCGPSTLGVLFIRK